MERINKGNLFGGSSTDFQLDAEKSYEMHKLVRRYLQHGFTREDTFSNVFYQLHSEMISADQINEYFQRLDSEPGYNWEANCSFNIYNLLSIIVEEFEVARSSISVWSDGSRKSFTFLNTRYGLLHDIALRYLFLLDNYTGQRREINIEDKYSFFDSNSYYSLKVVDQNHLLCTESNQNSQQSTVSLLQLDITESTCKILESSRLKGHDLRVVLDSTCRNKFAFLGTNKIGNFVQFGCATEGKLIIDPQITYYDEILCFPQLDGKQIRDFIRVLDETDDMFDKDEFVEFNVIPGMHHPNSTNLFSSTFADTSEKDYFPVYSHYTSSTHGFLFDTARRGINPIKISTIDLKQRKLTPVKYVYCNEFVLEDAYADGNALLMCVYNERSEEFVVHRLLLNQDQPESLFNQSFFKVRRQSMFCNNVVYNQLMPSMPNSLKPFAGLNMTS